LDDGNAAGQTQFPTTRDIAGHHWAIIALREQVFNSVSAGALRQNCPSDYTSQLW
jgi:hypothetical protein